MAQPKKLADSEILGILDDEIRQAVGYESSELSSQRQTALEYYYGEKFGNEVEGRSTYVSRDVADTIEWIMPSLMRIFTGGDTIVKFEPQGPEDEENAKQATDYVNYVFQRQNDGFLTLYTWFKDALLSKNGFVKVYRDKYTEYKVENYEALTDDEFAMLAQDKNVEVLEHSPYQTQDGVQYHDVKLRKKTEAGKTCVVPLPPEEFLVSKNPTAPLAKNRFRCHRRRVTLSELKEMGFEDVDDIGSDTEGDLNEERTARFAFDETDSVSEDSKDKASRTVWLSECLMKMDVDGDGIAEERTFIKAGNKLLQNEEGYTCHILTLTPIILPHKLFGMSVADLVMDLQLLKSTVFRQILDNMYLANNGRYMALDGMVNIDDLLTSRPGGIVRVKTFDAVKPMQPPLLGAPAFSLLEYIDTIKENRTGVTRYNQGTDADSLNKTASGINQIMSSSQQRIELIARVFAETGVKDLFYALLEMEQKHQDKAKVIRLRDQWVPMDPREWTNKFDLTVTVGLGTGSRESQLMALTEEAQYQLTLLQGGLCVTPENVYNLAIKRLEAKNIKGGEMFYTHPEKMPPAQPNPEMMEAQAKIQEGQAKLQMDAQKNEQKMAQDQQKMQQDFAMKSAETQQEVENQRVEMMLEVEKAKIMAEIEKMKAAAMIDLQREKASAEASLKRDSEAAKVQGENEQRQADTEEKSKEGDRMQQVIEAFTGAVDALAKAASAPKTRIPTYGKNGKIEKVEERSS
jgi:hypothetical protein